MIPENLKKYDYRENLIVDKNNPILIQKAWRDRFSSESHWCAGYGGQAYLSKPNSEDALTWNVFRTLQLSGNQGLKVVSDIFKISKVDKMLFWGCDVEHYGEEQQLLNILIQTIDGRHQGTMTEPDLVIITEKEVVFVECKLNQNSSTSPWKAQGKGAEKRFKTYAEIFPEIKSVPDWVTVYQLIRQYVFAKSLGEYLKKKPVVIPLINGKHKEILSPYYLKVKRSPLNKKDIFREFVTWQDISEIISAYDLPNRDTILAKIEEALKHAK
ncbi:MULTISPECIES: PGN_0703 family putative restriction endonuclease [unclassified Archaeoglobus]|jgi:hypothetical protein|uniref:PGN_0703 family putative restriction endonuclease n=1 Tax=unclassified Archaeoglobus TaxID=2643606 RepID=UPI0025BC33D0|nr:MULTISPECIES: hypothetical protein [unclassified Archaeoglobus]